MNAGYVASREHNRTKQFMAIFVFEHAPCAFRVRGKDLLLSLSQSSQFATRPVGDLVNQEQLSIDKFHSWLRHLGHIRSQSGHQHASSQNCNENPQLDVRSTCVREMASSSAMIPLHFRC